MASNDRLKMNDPELPKWKEVLAKLADYPVDENFKLFQGLQAVHLRSVSSPKPKQPERVYWQAAAAVAPRP